MQADLEIMSKQIAVQNLNSTESTLNIFVKITMYSANTIIERANSVFGNLHIKLYIWIFFPIFYLTTVYFLLLGLNKVKYDILDNISFFFILLGKMKK